MNFNLTNDDNDQYYSRKVLHEFGHALGAIHEHSSPATPINWNKEAVYKAHEGTTWDKAMVDHNIFFTYDKTLTNFTAFDPDSIMLYPFPPEWTLDGYSTKENTVLSKNDKDFMKQLYPFT